jgi:hypothetical protein
MPLQIKRVQTVRGTAAATGPAATSINHFGAIINIIKIPFGNGVDIRRSNRYASGSRRIWHRDDFAIFALIAGDLIGAAFIAAGLIRIPWGDVRLCRCLQAEKAQGDEEESVQVEFYRLVSFSYFLTVELAALAAKLSAS